MLNLTESGPKNKKNFLCKNDVYSFPVITLKLLLSFTPTPFE